MKKLILFLTLIILLFICTKAVSYSQTKGIDSLKKLLEKAIEDTNKVDILSTLGFSLYITDIHQAEEYAKHSLALSQKLSNRSGIAKSYNLLGLISRAIGNYPKAMEYLQKSLEIYEELKFKPGLATVYGNLGLIFFDQKNYPKALHFLTKSLDFEKSIGNSLGISRQYGNIGNIYALQENYSKALEYFENALKIKKEIGDKKGIATWMGNIGTIYVNLKDYKKSEECFLEALAINNEIGSKQGISINLGNIGELYIEQGKYKEAINVLTKSKRFAEEINFKQQLISIYQSLSDSYLYLGKYKEAYDYSVLYIKLKDSIFNLENSKKLSDIEAKFENDKRNKETELLKKDIQIKKLTLTRQNVIIYLSLSVILLLSVLAFVLLSRFRNKHKTNQLLAIKNEQITTQNDKLQGLNKELEDKNVKIETYLEYIDSELKKASDYLQSQLPPKINDRIKTDWLFVPSQRLGGDAFGYRWLDSEHFAFYLIDVSGHGVGASLHSINVLNMLKSDSRLNANFLEPRDVLFSLNQSFKMSQYHKMFFTIWYGVFNIETKILKYASAGHPSPILIYTNNEKAILDAPNIFIGALPNFQFNSKEIQVTNNARLYLFSDGVYEIIKKDNSFWDLESLYETLANYNDNSPNPPLLSGDDNDLQNLFDYVRIMHGGNDLDDDFSILKIYFNYEQNE